VKVMPRDYKRVLRELAEAEERREPEPQFAAGSQNGAVAGVIGAPHTHSPGRQG
jgi:hypothetical protein